MNIKIIEKPDWISWDDIHNLLMEAHKINIEKGIIMRNPMMPGDKIRRKLGSEGRCWVALDGEKLVGTSSVYFFEGKNWWNKGKNVANGCFTGILRSYQGIGIKEDFDAELVKYVKEHGVEMIQADTAENNTIMRKRWELSGCKIVAFYAPPSKHYSVISVYWLSKCPFSDKYINRRFKISEKLTKWQYKPGRIERSFIISFFCKVINKIVNLLL